MQFYGHAWNQSYYTIYISSSQDTLSIILLYFEIVYAYLIYQVGRRSEEFSEAQHVMRESVAQRRDMALIDDGRESTTPVEPTSGLGGEFRSSHETLYDTSIDSISYAERSSDSENVDDNADSSGRITITYNTRL